MAIKLHLIRKLIQALNSHSIPYCHWKSNQALDKSLCGINDLDLLVSKHHKEEFLRILSELGFIKALSYNDSWFSSITHYYGYSDESETLVHIHLHFDLFVGHDLIKNYHLPAEEILLTSTTNTKGIVTPTFELELIILVVRIVLKHRLMSVILGHPNNWIKALIGKSPYILSKSENEELCYLTEKANLKDLYELLSIYFPYISNELYEYCLASTSYNAGKYSWLIASIRLTHALKPYQRHSTTKATALVTWRMLILIIKSLLIRFHLIKSYKKRLSVNGKIFAFVGGDGAGKTTNIIDLNSWLGRYFEVRTIHIGRPRKGPFWYTVHILLLLRRIFFRKNNDNFHQSIKYLLLAKYRYRAFCKAVHLRSKGFIVLLDRIPLPGLKHMDAPRILSISGGKGIFSYMSSIERNYYNKIRGADEIIALRLDPQIARHRRPRDDPEELAMRSGEIWNYKWPEGYANIIDAAESKYHVREKIRTIIWHGLQNQQLIIELIGPAGVGKTTLATTLLKDTCNVQNSLEWTHKRYIYGIYRLPYLLPILITGNSIEYWKALVKIEAILSVISKHNKKLIPCIICLLDNGPILLLAYLYKEKLAKNNSWLVYLEEKISKTFDAVIWLDAPDMILYERINRRDDGHRMINKPREIVHHFYDNYRQCFNKVLDNLSKDVTALKIDTSQNNIKDTSKEVKVIIYDTDL